MKDIFRVLRTLQVNSEKAQILTEKNNEYVFKVDRKANKLEIKRAVAEIFGKKVVSVRTANYKGKKEKRKNESSDGTQG
jgi:large subunit ribosomal protein L23